MDLSAGSNIVHPVHGPTTVVDHVTRTVAGVEREYVVLRHVEQDLELLLPKEQLEELDLRPALEEDEVEDVLELLASDPDGMEAPGSAVEAADPAGQRRRPAA